jgi:beta-glucosidase-like glycosyl hydrolase
VQSGMLNISLVDAALENAFKVRIRLGLFDPAAGQPDYGPELVGSAEHRALSEHASRQAMTLLSNRPAAGAAAAAGYIYAAAPPSGGVLPLAKRKKLAVIGPNADTRTLMAGGTGGGLLSAQV